MDYKIINNKILIEDTSEFNPKHIFDCGQVFRYLNCDSSYKIFSKKSFCSLIYIQGCVTIVSEEPKLYKKYFDLDNNYAKIKQELLNAFPNMQQAIEFGSGIRILNQDPWEMIISFIISSNNNIPRIKGILERLCKTSGQPIGEGYTFPSAEELKGRSVDYYKGLGTGYRASYLYKTVDAIANGFELDLEEMDTSSARKHLMQLTGVGRKVADCILLFGYHRTDVFPVDVWTERVYDDLFGASAISAERKADILCNHFGSLSGYAQQYLYYFYRENNVK